MLYIHSNDNSGHTEPTDSIMGRACALRNICSEQRQYQRLHPHNCLAWIQIQRKAGLYPIQSCVEPSMGSRTGRKWRFSSVASSSSLGHCLGRCLQSSRPSIPVLHLRSQEQKEHTYESEKGSSKWPRRGDLPRCIERDNSSLSMPCLDHRSFLNCAERNPD